CMQNLEFPPFTF
nr:immunoglobulin light chain junction region [Macaca mulatta]MOW52827.1 immunoglobulin light chain junction region [Macaca mulatta]MOW53041.1 immunoglobulin light chain junction region [Macaca mulatta]MOW53189.1 immunoglobulin light chain junction region [Macaca mulatta]MOW53604.1 immunoglobulin light chain junction region [Macaca mulatta]